LIYGNSATLLTITITNHTSYSYVADSDQRSALMALFITAWASM
jgi:hypothetical protein